MHALLNLLSLINFGIKATIAVITYIKDHTIVVISLNFIFYKWRKDSLDIYE